MSPPRQALFRLKKISKALFFLAAALYPALVFYFITVRNMPLRQFSLFVIAFAVFAFVAGTSRRGAARGTPFFRGSLLLLGLGILTLVTDSATVLKFYPVLMNALLLAFFGSTLLFPPNMAFRFAAMQDKSIRSSLGEKRIEAYCRKVTITWCAFFIVNGGIAAWTVFSGSDILWSVYNGGISYGLIGALFAGEFVVRKMVQKGMPKAVPLSELKNSSRDASAVLCYDGSWSDSLHKTWGDFLEGSAKLRQKIGEAGGKRWLLFCDDGWHFLLAFAALLQCRKEILLCAHISPACLEEMRGGAPMLTDREGEGSETVFSVPALLGADLQKGALAKEAPAIAADETSIVMHTSGSTGKPKEVRQRLAEFESDNRFALSKWGGELLARKLCSTVSHHHIYGLLYSVLLPFTAGIPFRRKRIDFPEELEKLRDAEYALVTVPAFLKRAVEIKSNGPCLKSPWIFSSGGVLEPETARKARDVLGFWPVEVYGSTETSGIAWRQSASGPEWTPFDNAHLSANRDGCLVVRSPCIKSAAGFETFDLAEILEDGRFLLKGRMDSIVKIEEKRVSLLEIEDRIMQSGLAADACAVALEGRRQYLAAAVVFNGRGRERFAGLEKSEIGKFWREHLLQYFENIVIPKKWRYLDALPMDAQGKKRKDDIKLLFQKAAGGFGGLGMEKLVERTENSVSLELSIPDSSPYFDGHFPGFPVLPAVAQVELAARFASRYLGTSVALSEIRRVKFTNLVRPNAPLLLKLEKADWAITFSLSSPKGKTVYSLGTIVQGESPRQFSAAALSAGIE